MLTVELVQKALQCSNNIPLITEFTDVTTDSRTIAAGNLFVALKGEKFDGHAFVEKAFAKGAAAAVVEHVPDHVDARHCFVVQDTLLAYQQIAKAYRLSFPKLKVIAITGSNGKTTTKDMISAVLEERYRVVKTQANFNNEIGLPKTLFAIQPDTEIAVVEMGMRGLGQIRAMKAIAVPDAAVITNVGEAHLELLGSIENIAKAKSEILENFTASNDAFLNGDDPRVRDMQTGATVHTYGVDSAADVKAVSVEGKGLETEFAYVSRITGNLQTVRLPLLGRHNVLDALAAIAVGEVYGVPDENIAHGLEHLQMTGMRQEILQFGDITVINDAYNASPASMKAGLEALQNVARSKGRGRAVAVLADMLELGSHSRSGHEAVGKWAGQYGVEELICYGPASCYMAQAAQKAGVTVQYCVDQKTAAKVLAKSLQPGDTVLLKGSHAMGVDQLVSMVFTDKEDVQ